MYYMGNWFAGDIAGANADDHKNYVAELFGLQMSPETFAAKMQEMNN